MLLRTLALLMVASAESAKILVVIPTPAYSHVKFAGSICRELASRGNEVTLVTTVSGTNLTNLTEIIVNIEGGLNANTLHKQNSLNMLFGIQNYLMQICEKIYGDETIRKLLGTERFDLVMIEWNVVPCFSVLKKHFDAPLIGLRSLGLRLEGHDSIGNPTNPSYISMAYNSHEDTLWGCLKDVLFSLVWRLHYHFYVVPCAQKIVDKFFPSNQIDVWSLEQSVDVILTNTNYLLNGVRPLVPAMVEVGMLHVGNDRSELPLKVKNFLDQNYFIFCNFGTLFKSQNLSDTMLNVFLRTFGELNYNVLWKFESNNAVDLPENVMVSNWLPQEAILAHPNIKCFISHGGLLSLQESVFYGVPLIVIPLLFDQPYNAFRVSLLEIGKVLDFYSINENNLRNAIHEIIDEGNKYKNKIKKLSSLLKDLPMKPLDKAMWWIDYVIRNNGAPLIKSKAVGMSWFKYLLMHIIAVLLFFCIATWIIIRRYFYAKKFIKIE